MENVKPIIAYNLRNADGRELMLQLGIVENTIRSNTAFRWRFFGRKIPMPVRSATWFCGFPADTMLKWLSEQGWALVAKVQIHSGYTHVYELPSKGNETHSNENKETAGVDYRYVYEDRFNEAIRFLNKKGNHYLSVRVYQYAHNCCVKEAHNAVTEILALDNEQ